jgi:hypothetical protein
MISNRKILGVCIFTMISFGSCSAMLQCIPDAKRRAETNASIKKAFEKLPEYGDWNHYLDGILSLGSDLYRNVYANKWLWIKSSWLTQNPTLVQSTSYSLNSFLEDIIRLLKDRKYRDAFMVAVQKLSAHESAFVLAIIYEIAQGLGISSNIHYFICYDFNSKKTLYFSPMTGDLIGFHDYKCKEPDFSLERSTQKQRDALLVGINVDNICITKLGFEPY